MHYPMEVILCSYRFNSCTVSNQIQITEPDSYYLQLLLQMQCVLDILMELQILLLMEEQCLIPQIGLDKITTLLLLEIIVLVTDNNGCTNSLNFNISEPE